MRLNFKMTLTMLAFSLLVTGVILVSFFFLRNNLEGISIASTLGEDVYFMEEVASALLKRFFLQNQRLTRTADKKKGPQTADLNLFDGAPGRIRTHDPLVRSQVLYPTELLAHI